MKRILFIRRNRKSSIVIKSLPERDLKIVDGHYQVIHPDVYHDKL